MKGRDNNRQYEILRHLCAPLRVKMMAAEQAEPFVRAQ
jgi:hypothetical protein